MRFVLTGLTPYTRYKISVRAKTAGELGPATENVVITLSEGEHTRKVMYRTSSSAHVQSSVVFCIFLCVNLCFCSCE